MLDPDLKGGDLCVLLTTLDEKFVAGLVVEVVKPDEYCFWCLQWHYIIFEDATIVVIARRQDLKKIDDDDDARPTQKSEWIKYIWHSITETV